jgi:hypothetical protein
MCSRIERWSIDIFIGYCGLYSMCAPLNFYKGSGSIHCGFMSGFSMCVKNVSFFVNSAVGWCQFLALSPLE